LHFQIHQMLEQELLKKVNGIRTINTQLKTERNWRSVMDNKPSVSNFTQQPELGVLRNEGIEK
jgi:hypothetical protein